MPESFWDMQRNKHCATQNLRRANVVISYLVQPGWSPGIIVCLSASGICNIINIFRHKILGKRCHILSGSARLETRHHCMPESFWDMQHNKHCATQNLRRANVVISYLVQPGWSPGIIVCLRASGICNVITLCDTKS